MGRGQLNTSGLIATVYKSQVGRQILWNTPYTPLAILRSVLVTLLPTYLIWITPSPSPLPPVAYASWRQSHNTRIVHRINIISIHARSHRRHSVVSPWRGPNITAASMYARHLYRTYQKSWLMAVEYRRVSITYTM